MSTDFKPEHVGQSFDDFLHEEGIYEEVTLAALKESVADLIRMEMEKKDISKIKMARMMGTSRSSLDRLLKANKDVRLTTIGKAASVLGKRLTIGLENMEQTPAASNAVREG